VLSSSGQSLLGLRGQPAKPGRLEVADCSSTPLHRLRHRQGFIGDHRLQRGGRALLGGSDGGISISKRRQHLDGQLLQAPVTLGPGSRRRFAYTSDAASLAACLNVCLPIPASLIDRDPHSLRLLRPAERSSPQMQLEWRTSTRVGIEATVKRPLGPPQVLSVEATPCSQGGSTCISVPRQRQVSDFSPRLGKAGVSIGQPGRSASGRRLAIDGSARRTSDTDAAERASLRQRR